MANAPAAQQQAAQPGALFGIPKYGTYPRYIPDSANENLGATPLKGSQIKVQTTRLDQLDIVAGWKLHCTLEGTWTAGEGQTLHDSPFGIASAFEQLNVKLQAAYSTFNLSGPLAALMQGYRPMWGSRTPSQRLAVTDPFAAMEVITHNGQAESHSFTVDLPAALKIDEYYNLTATGDPQQKILDALVSPVYMASQARTVMPTITLAPMAGVGDALTSPVTIATDDTTSTFTAGDFDGSMVRDAFWTSDNPLANPIQYPWLYTRDMFEVPTTGQGKVSCLLQNTGVSVGQVMSLCGFVWDPDANDGYGQIVPFSSIDNFELVIGGSLQNLKLTPQAMEDHMWTRHPNLADIGAWADGAFLLDFATVPEGGYITNAYAINTYVLNGVALNITFASGHTPGSNSKVVLGVEALKLVTS